MKLLKYTLMLSLAALWMNCGLEGGSDEDVTMIKIMNAEDGSGTEIDGLTLQAGTVETLYAVAYDDAGDVVTDISVDWTVAGGIGTCSPLSGTYTVFTPGTIDAPSGVVSVTKDGKIALSWVAPAATVDSYKVYNSVNPNGSSPTLGAVTTSTGATDSTVSNGTKNYFYVTSVNMSGSISASNSTGTTGSTGTIVVTGESDKSNIVDDAACDQYFSASNFLYERTSNNGESAVMFSTGTYESLGVGHGEADIYLTDDSGLLFKSVGELNSFSRNSKIYYFGVYDFDAPEVSVAPLYTDAGYAVSQSVVQGGVYAVYTDDGNYVKLRVSAVGGTGDDEFVVINFGYQSIAGYTNFKAAAK